MVFGCVAWAAERLDFGVEVRFARSSFIFLYAVLAGLGSFLGGVWLFRMGCREVGFWCGGAFYTVEFHLCLGHQKVALESFFGAAGLAGLGSFLGGVWLFRVCCGEVGFGVEVRFAWSSFIFL